MFPTLFFKNLRVADLGSHHLFPEGVAYFSDDRWWYSGVRSGGAAAPAPIESQQLSSIRDWIVATFGDASPVETAYRPGTAYKRIFQTFAINGNLNNAIDQEAMNQSFVALELLIDKMQQIFKTVEPSPDNSKAYGHETRELLLLASMEVENAWAAVLNANGYNAARFTTKDYVKLLSPMLLDAHTLSLARYPSYPSFTPFRNWDAGEPTKSLAWYHAYNETKHNREKNLNAATLENCMSAVGAAAIVFGAQFGGGVFRPGDERQFRVRAVFESRTDFSNYPTSCYIPNAVGRPTTSPTSVWDWELVDYPFT